MKIRIFTIPVFNGDEQTADLNRFLASNQIAELHREFVNNGSNSLWSICVTTNKGDQKPEALRKSRVDYREILSPPDFAVFAQLRSLRKEISDQEGVPPYALFTNEQLAEMVRRRVNTDSALQEIDGIGPTRIEKYSERFLAALAIALNKTTNPSNDATTD